LLIGYYVEKIIMSELFNIIRRGKEVRTKKSIKHKLLLGIGSLIVGIALLIMMLYDININKSNFHIGISFIILFIMWIVFGISHIIGYLYIYHKKDN